MDEASPYKRVLQDLRRQGLISLHGRKLVIHRWPALIKVPEFDPGDLHLEKQAAIRLGSAGRLQD